MARHTQPSKKLSVTHLTQVSGVPGSHFGVSVLATLHTLGPHIWEFLLVGQDLKIGLKALGDCAANHWGASLQHSPGGTSLFANNRE